MKTVGQIGIAVVGLAVLYTVFKLMKVKINYRRAERDGYACGGCDKGKVICTKTEQKDEAQMGLDFPCGLLPNFLK